MRRSEKLLLWASQTINALVGGDPDESLSARAFREQRTTWISRIDRVFGKDHCRDAWVAQTKRALQRMSVKRTGSPTLQPWQ